MSGIALRNLTKSYGTVSVIENLNLDIRDKEFISFVGPSGCGKSTLLRMICGIEDITAGTIEMDGQVMNDKPPYERGVSMVFQSYALYPHMTVRQNMGYSLKLAKVPKAEIEAKVNEAAEILKITPLLDRLPKQLSGGQRQRVAIGRSIVRKPEVFLFDEPLSNLDAELRVEMRVEIARLASRVGTTMVYVTHDQTEAMTLSDRIVVLKDGAIQQVASPLEIYENPANRFVASFIGSPKMNIFVGQLSGDLFTFADGAKLPLGGLIVGSAPDKIELGIRPEHMVPAEAGQGVVSGKVVVVERLGGDTFAHIESPASERTVIVRLPPNNAVRAGEALHLQFNPAHGHLFDAVTGARLSADHAVAAA